MFDVSEVGSKLKEAAEVANSTPEEVAIELHKYIDEALAAGCIANGLDWIRTIQATNLRQLKFEVKKYTTTN